MKQKLIGNILNKMHTYLNKEQLSVLNTVLYSEFINYDIVEKEYEIMETDYDWQNDLKDFLIQKKIEGKADSTLKQYKYQLFKLLSSINKKLIKITDGDVFNYVMRYKATHPDISNRSLENMRLCFSSFFQWAFTTKRISSNIMVTIKRIKCDYVLKESFTDEEREILHCSADNVRDIAILEFLYSTAVRVSEMVNLNIDDIKFGQNELVVFGKGHKERVVYLNAKSSLYLKKYLESRNDNNPALFVSLNSPHNRLTVSGVENILRKLGKKSGIKNVHPHRFRRTAATNALNRGMELQYVQTMLGHTSTDTTMLYCNIQNSNVKSAHVKYLAA